MRAHWEERCISNKDSFALANTMYLIMIITIYISEERHAPSQKTEPDHVYEQTHSWDGRTVERTELLAANNYRILITMTKRCRILPINDHSTTSCVPCINGPRCINDRAFAFLYELAISIHTYIDLFFLPPHSLTRA